MTFIIKTLIALNLLGFLCYLMGLNNVYGLHSNYRVWDLLVYGFLHNGAIHLFVNMMGLYFFGNELSRVIGWKQFLVLYLGSIVLSGFSITHGLNGYCVGASGGVFALISAYGLKFPRRKIGFVFTSIKIPAQMLFIGLFILQMSLLLSFGEYGSISYLNHVIGMILGIMWFFFIDK